ncbi:MAG: prepilin-type N-terminal cleavage/methylation domain-containing protein [Deltaproteobacteria bacterium]|nr:prepilin-type N-terminal cleavage/methylation domain-containing protein [Deltaproteobacteria bacterium]
MKNQENGFTLIELSIVLLVIGLVLGIVVPRFQNFLEVDLKSASRRLAGAIKYTYDRAIFTRNTLRLFMDLKENTYWTEVCASVTTEACEWVADSSVLGRKTKLPHGISFRDIFINGEEVDATAVGLHFYPSGFVIPSTIHLWDGKEDHTLSLIINSVTGKADIYKGYKVEVKQFEFE